MTRPSKNAPCPCGSGRKAKGCCLRLLEGTPAPTPESLMRSRFVAYAAGDAAYILRTTHPDSPHLESDLAAWTASILQFSRTEFRALEILEASGSTVSFRATLFRDGVDVSFTERSRFAQVAGAWMYLDGEA